MPEQTSTPIGLLAEHPALKDKAAVIGQRFGLPVIRKPPGDAYYLVLRDTGLELLQPDSQAAGAIRIEFAAGAMGHRLRFGGGRGQPLARAVGMKPGFNPVIWDATAGLGRDGFVLASLGSRVTLCERSAVLAALLEDGLRRAALNHDIGDWVSQRIALVFGEAGQRLAELSADERPDTIYLDPMYPPGKAHVLVKKEIRALQHIIGPDQDSESLLHTALNTARRRVVVKRPRRAGWLSELKPSTSIESKKTRYDVYVTL